MPNIEGAQYPHLRLPIRSGIKPIGISILDVAELPVTDASGIPQDSDRAPEALIKNIDFQYGECPFHHSSSRFRATNPDTKPMSFLERNRLRDNFDEVIGMLSNIRSEFINIARVANGRAMTDPLNVTEIRALLRAIKYLPQFAVLRANSPVALHGALPSSAIILANGVGGALGGVESLYNSHKDRFGNEPAYVGERVPTVDKIIEAAERNKSLVGEKTVCVASPHRMQRFIDAIIHGTDQRVDTSTFFDPSEELRALVLFGQEVYLTSIRKQEFKQVDKCAFALIDPLVRKGRNPRDYRDAVREFKDLADKVLVEFNGRQLRANVGLGRDKGPNITLDTFKKKADFKMPDLLKKIKS